MNETPVTVLMPVYNAAPYLRLAMDSVLSQTHRNFEFLIINDGSTDGSADILRSYKDSRIRLVNNESNIGLVATLNKGLNLASHELVARQDADDISEPERLSAQTLRMMENPSIALLGTQARMIGGDGSDVDMGVLEKPVSEFAIRWYQLFDNPFIHSSVMFRKSVAVGECGAYPDSRACEDYDLWARMAENHRVESLPEKLVHYRTHSASIIGSLGRQDGNKKDGAIADRKKIIARVARNTFGEDLPEGDIAALESFIRGAEHFEADTFLSAFDRTLSKFTRAFPGALDCANFHQTVASQLATAAYWLIPSDRSRAWDIYRKAISFHPPIKKRLQWKKIAALWIFGGKARSIFRTVRKISGR